MTKRYHGKDLEADVAELNATLEKHNSPWRLHVGYAYNRTELDQCTPEQLSKHCRHRNLFLGTPRECLAEANSFVLFELTKRPHA